MKIEMITVFQSKRGFRFYLSESIKFETLKTNCLRIEFMFGTSIDIFLMGLFKLFRI